MQDSPPQEKPKISIFKLVIVAVVGLFLFVIAGFMVFIWPFLFPPSWTVEMNRAEQLWETNPNQAALKMQNAIAEAKTAHAPVADVMGLHRTFARHLYDSHKWRLADEQIAQAIALCPRDPAPNSAEADQLTHAYQDRAFDAYQRHLNNPQGPSGQADQERSVEIAEKAFGPDHEQTIYKVPTLALIYSSSGQTEKAHKTMQRAIDAVENKPSAKECAWFVYGCDARMKVAEHNYKDGMISFVHALKITADNQNHRDRVWGDVVGELERQKGKGHPELKDVRKLFNQQKYEELESLADKLRKDATQNPNGSWVLDSYYTTLLNDDQASERDYDQLLFDLNDWRKKHPDSIAARIALCEAYIDFAWFARGHGYADSVDEQAWNNFSSRLKLAQETLDADASIKSKTPIAYAEYARIYQGLGTGKKEYYKLLDACHKDWSDYIGADKCATYFLLPRWYGEQNEVEQFITKRGDAMGGTKGDRVYAQLVWKCYQYLENPFARDAVLKWPRVKAGFKQIFSEYPADMDSRVAFINMCYIANDFSSIESALDGYRN